MKESSKRKTKPKVRIKKIEIESSDFLLQAENPTDGYSEFPYLDYWNLYLPKTVHKGKSNEKTELKWYAVCNTVTAINTIAWNRVLSSCENPLFKGKGDEGLAKFIEKFMKCRNELISIFDKSEEDWLQIFKCDLKKKSFKAII